MKRRSPVLFPLILALSLLATTLPFGPTLFAQEGTAPSPADTTTLRLAGLRQRVTVRRDERGIPYIEADNEEDLYFAQGYVIASDRLWQMDLLRRTARGELAEIFGPTVLEGDKRHRTLGFAQLSEAMATRLSPALRTAVEAYARGVNAFIDSRDEKTLPLEFRILQYRPRPWRPTDSLLIGKLFDESLTNTWLTDIVRAAFDDLPKDRREALSSSTSPLDVVLVGSDKGPKKRATPATGPAGFSSPSTRASADLLRALAPIRETTERSLERVGILAEGGAASNNWVVSGKRTATGKPLLANDPHLNASAPSIWYMADLRAPGLSVAGVAAVGAPGITIGHNERIAWGATSLEPDVQDLYLEKFDPANPRRYLTPGGWREAEIRREEIRVRKGFSDTTTETVTFDVTVTRHGPIVFERGGARFALRWTALDPQKDFFGPFSAINRARNWDEFCSALSGYGGAPFNFVYADRDGHIGYYGAGPFPIRKTGDGSVPYDGADDAGEWVGFVPFKELPHLYDPPSGVIVTANNRIVGLDYPYHLTHNWAPPYRARRIYDLLTAKEKLTADDFRRIQGDTHSLPDAIFTSEVSKLARPLSSSEWQEMRAAFEGWDAVASAESRVMPLAVEMRRAFQRRILTAALGEERAREYGWATEQTFIDWIITTRPRDWLPKEFDSYEALLLASYKEALESLTQRLGADRSQWTWGRMGQVRFPHPLGPLPRAGTVFIIPPLPQNTGGTTRTVNAGSAVSMRFIADLSDWDQTLQGIALGQSGDPASPHWKDQLMDWYGVRPRVFPFTPNAVARAAKETLVLVPAMK